MELCIGFPICFHDTFLEDLCHQMSRETMPLHVEENTTNSSWTLTNGNARCNVLHKRADVGVRGDVTFIWYRSRAFLSNADLVHVNSSYNIFQLSKIMKQLIWKSLLLSKSIKPIYPRKFNHRNKMAITPTSNFISWKGLFIMSSPNAIKILEIVIAQHQGF